MSDHIIDQKGEKRFLGKLPPDPAKRKLFAPITEVVPLVPRSEWKELNRTALFKNTISNQRSHGSCVGYSSAAALSRLRVLEGQTYQRLSGSYVYSFINGHRDEGAIISDSLDVLKGGVCLESEAGWDQIYPEQIPSSARETAKRFALLEAYRADDFDQIMSGIQLGFMGVGAVMVGSNFDKLSPEGVAGYDRGPGNHAVGFTGAKKLSSGQWVLETANSWGDWGLDGFCYVTEQMIEGVMQDSYLIRAATVDPQEPGPPVVA